jgi:hypothetical protein
MRLRPCRTVLWVSGVVSPRWTRPRPSAVLESQLPLPSWLATQLCSPMRTMTRCSPFVTCIRRRTRLRQGDARSSSGGGASKTWCPGCSSDPTWPPGVADPAVVAAENQARQQRIEKIKASRNTRIVKVTQIGVERGFITDQQAAQLLAVWHEIQSAPN